MLHALAHFFGIDNLSGPFYGFWSGVGSDVSELAIPGAMYALYRRHNCHAHRCWRLGRFPHPDGWTVCHRHHPDGAPRLDRRP